MKKTIKTSEVLAVYNVLNAAKYSKMDDADKIKVWKINRALKPTAVKFEEDNKDAAEKMKPSEDFQDRLSKAQEYERLRQAKEPTIDIMTTAEYDAFIKEFNKYNELVREAVKTAAEKNVKIEFAPISEDAFAKMLASNEWTVEQATIVGDFIVE